ncbi:MAG: hypothetical protein ACJ8EY_09015 [Sphingomicrobium sp.]
MLSSRMRNALILLTATAGLSGCVGMDPYGYGYGSGVSIGYGNGGYYSPYGGYGGYGGYSAYGSPYYASGYGSPYYGWYDDFYYPGTGYYVYSRSGSRQRWSDTQRRYWESRRGDRRVSGDNWSGYRTGDRTWTRSGDGTWTRNGTTTETGGTTTRSWRDGRLSRQPRTATSTTTTTTTTGDTSTGSRWGGRSRTTTRDTVRTTRSSTSSDRGNRRGRLSRSDD